MSKEGKKKVKWSLPKSGEVGELKIQKVERLNADGTKTDITDKLEEWFPKIPDEPTEEEIALFKRYVYWTQEEIDSYNHGIHDSIKSLSKHLPNRDDASGLCVDSLEYELNLIIDELSKLQK